MNRIVTATDIQRIFHRLIPASYLQFNLGGLHSVRFSDVRQVFSHRDQIALPYILKILPGACITPALLARLAVILQYQEWVIGCCPDRVRAYAHIINGPLAFFRFALHRSGANFAAFFIQRKYHVACFDIPNRDWATSSKNPGCASQAFILRAYASQEFLLGFGDAQFIKGTLDPFGHVIPRAAFL